MTDHQSFYRLVYGDNNYNGSMIIPSFLLLSNQQSNPTWRFPETGLPLNHPVFEGIFHSKPPILGTPIDGNHHRDHLGPYNGF